MPRWSSAIEIPQIPGSLRRSRPVRGVAEGALKTKRYLAALLVIQPEVLAGCAIVYLKEGRWKPGDGAELAGPETFGEAAALATVLPEGRVAAKANEHGSD